MVSNRGIEVDLKKLKAIIDMPPPRNLKQLRILQGKINSIKRFISQLGNKCRPLKANAKLIKQKPRKMHPSKALLVKTEIENYFQVVLIESIDYSEWMSNIVPVTKPTGEIRVCTDFRDINNACPKDDFPLLNIDMIVDSIASHNMLSFMDGSFGYNQILINLVDQHKTTFTTPWGNFCWKVMPFGLTNAGATYQRAVVSMFHNHIHKIVEVYVDDILIKSNHVQDHLQALEEVFDILQR